MRHLDLVLQKRDLSGLYSSLSVKLQAFLMARVGDIAASALHGEGLRPYSLFTLEQRRDIVFRLNMLTDDALPLYNAAKSIRVFDVSGIEGGIAVLDALESETATFPELSEAPSKRLKVLLASPATYKHNGDYSNIFALAPLFTSVADKLRQFEGVDFPAEEIAELMETLVFRDYRLNSASFRVKRGNVIPAFSGEMTLELTGTPAQNAKLITLFRYAEYAGWGAKTALGMGGVLVDER